MAPETDSSLVLLNDQQACLKLDPVDTSDSPESVAFDIAFQWNMPFQQCTLIDRSHWFDIESLRRFETEIANTIKNKNGVATLVDMSERPVLELGMNENKVLIRLHARDSMNMGALTFSIQTYAKELVDVRERLRNYPKWW